MDTIILYKPNTEEKQVEIKSDELERIVEHFGITHSEIHILFKKNNFAVFMAKLPAVLNSGFNWFKAFFPFLGNRPN